MHLGNPPGSAGVVDFQLLCHEDPDIFYMF
jgi:hypothetical protein